MQGFPHHSSRNLGRWGTVRLRMTLWNVAVLALILGAMGGVVPYTVQADRFLAANKAGLVLEGKPYRNVGANMPDLFERFLHGQDKDAIRSLSDAHECGIRFARCFGSTWAPTDFHIFEDDRPRWMSAYGRMLAAADRAGIAVVPSLLFNANMLPDYIHAKTGRDERIVDLLTQGTASNRLAVEYVTAIVTRYRKDPRVLFWEIGNEYNLDADLSAQWKRRPANQIPTSDQVRAFLSQMAGSIKRIDRNHLVTSGNADMRPYAWHIRHAMLAHRHAAEPFDYPMDWRKDSYEQYLQMLRFFNPPPLDLISVHQYPTGPDAPSWIPADDTHALMLGWSCKAAARIGQPLFVGEFAQHTVVNGKEVPSLWSLDFLGQISGGASAVSAVWAWEYDEDEPSQSPFALSPSRTPNLVRAIRETNEALAHGKEPNTAPATGRSRRRPFRANAPQAPGSSP